MSIKFYYVGFLYWHVIDAIELKPRISQQSGYEKIWIDRKLFKSPNQAVICISILWHFKIKFFIFNQKKKRYSKAYSIAALLQNNNKKVVPVTKISSKTRCCQNFYWQDLWSIFGKITNYFLKMSNSLTLCVLFFFYSESS